MYLLVKPDDDGTKILALNDVQLAEFLTDPRGYASVKNFATAAVINGDWDASYWPEGQAVLLKAEIIVPVPVTTAWRLP